MGRRLGGGWIGVGRGGIKLVRWNGRKIGKEGRGQRCVGVGSLDEYVITVNGFVDSFWNGVNVN